VETDRTFDKLERPLTETFPSYSSENIAYTYDSTSGGNKGIGHLTSFSDESGSTTQKFDSFGNMIQTVRTIGSNNCTTSYSYDLDNRLTEIIYPSGRYVDYTYDSSGYLTTVTTKPTSGGTVTTLASSIVHKPLGPIASFTYGNSEAQTRTFDNNYWLDDLVTPYSGTDIQNLTYGFDYAGNLTSITDNLAAGRDETYTVDSLNRLHTASGAYGSRTYTYDNNSNRLTRVYGGTTQTSTITASTNLLASITDGTNTRHFTYSASGNMASDDRVMNGGVAASMTYGGRDRLESITIGTPTITFKINALGQRVQKATTGATTDYHYDIFGHIIGESDDSTGNDIVEYVFMGNLPLAQIDSSGNIFYIHTNQVDAPQKMTNASRTLVWDYEIEPFGETYATPTNTTPTNHRFPGQYADAEDLLSYNYARDYDPTLGRYPEADPTGLAGGLNLFGYVRQNPVERVDRFGLEDEDADEARAEAEDANQVLRDVAYNNYVAQILALEPNNQNLTGVESVGHQTTEEDVQRAADELANAQARAQAAADQCAQCQIDQGQQDKHIPGTNNYDESAGRSILTYSDPQFLLSTYGGTGQSLNDTPIGQAGSRERVDFGTMIGLRVFPDGSSVPTTVGIIHYSNSGAHIVPANPVDWGGE
jgi:RHS repeat-associated protein